MVASDIVAQFVLFAAAHTAVHFAEVLISAVTCRPYRQRRPFSC